jgi:hypothetical protein
MCDVRARRRPCVVRFGWGSMPMRQTQEPLEAVDSIGSQVFEDVRRRDLWIVGSKRLANEAEQRVETR